MHLNKYFYKNSNCVDVQSKLQNNIKITLSAFIFDFNNLISKRLLLCDRDASRTLMSPSKSINY